MVSNQRKKAGINRRRLKAIRTSGAVILILYLVLTPFHSSRGRQVAPSGTLLRIAGGEIEVALPNEPMRVSGEELLAWVKAAGHAVSEYYGHFPVEHVTLRVRAVNGAGVRHGITYPKDGGLILISVGKETDVDDLKTDWTLTHEMTHLAFPNMERDQHWIEEGTATYVEPVARAQTGELSAGEVWKEFARDMSKGQPEPGDQGLDNTHTWGRTYWGGALFCLLADVQIRENTHNKRGLQDALRGIVGHGGVISEDWEIERALGIGDKATGTNVLQQLYQQMRDKPVTVNLDEIWKKLGVAMRDGEVVFNDQATEASIRKAITAARR